MKLAPITSHRKNIQKETETRKNKNWSDDEKAMAKKMYREGYSVKGIASILNRSHTSVATFVYRRKKMTSYDYQRFT